MGVSSCLCLARWMDIHGDGDGRFYHALILPRDSLDKDDADNDYARTFFVDYGNQVDLNWGQIFQLPDALTRHKHQAMEFCLQGIQPNPARYFEGWPSRGGAGGGDGRSSDSSPSVNVTDRAVAALEGKPELFVQI